jgi:hypothetical protein
MSLLRSLVNCFATNSINISRLWRSGIGESASSVYSASWLSTRAAKNAKRITSFPLHQYQYVARPPVISKVKPVVKLAPGETMNEARCAISSSVPQRFIGILSVMYFT